MNYCLVVDSRRERRMCAAFR